MANIITIMPEFEVTIHDTVRVCCHYSCEWRQSDFCALFNADLDYDTVNGAHVRDASCIAAEMARDSYNSFVPPHLIKIPVIFRTQEKPS